MDYGTYSCGQGAFLDKGKGHVHSDSEGHPIIHSPTDPFTFKQEAFPPVSTKRRVLTHPYEEGLRTRKARILHAYDNSVALPSCRVAVPTRVGGNWNRGRSRSKGNRGRGKRARGKSGRLGENDLVPVDLNLGDFREVRVKFVDVLHVGDGAPFPHVAEHDVEGQSHLQGCGGWPSAATNPQ